MIIKRLKAERGFEKLMTGKERKIETEGTGKAIAFSTPKFSMTFLKQKLQTSSFHELQKQGFIRATRAKMG